MASGLEPNKMPQLPKDKKSVKVSALSKTSAAKNSKRTVTSWDPLSSSDWDQAGPPGTLAATRIKRDITSLIHDPLPGIFILPDETNFCIVHCLIVGPFDTPYEGGFFNFVVRFGPSYPLHPPRVRFQSTDAGNVRFNPNLYSNGKVCLSILGTWTGPAWSPASNLGSLLLSIQSLLNEKPYYNEPGFRKENFSRESDIYNQFVTHETIRVAVCSHMENILNEDANFTEKELAEVAKSTFMEFYDHYTDICEKNLHLDKDDMKDVFSVQRQRFNYGGLLSRLRSVKEKLKISSGDRESPMSTISDTSDENNKQVADSGATLSDAGESEDEGLETKLASGYSKSSSSGEKSSKNDESSYLGNSDDWFYYDDEEIEEYDDDDDLSET